MKTTFIRILLSSALGLLFFFPLKGDVVEEGQVDITFKVINISKFGDYQFYFLYEDYVYDEGWQLGSVDTVWIEEGKEYSAGDKGSTSQLYARLRSDHSISFESEKEVGGDDIVSEKSVIGLLDEVEIKSVSGETITFKIKKRIKVHNNGDRTEIDPEGGIFGGINGGPFQLFGINGLWIMLPVTALFCLMILFTWRLRLKRRSHAEFAG